MATQSVSASLISLFEPPVICRVSFSFRLAESYSLLVEHLLNKCAKVDKRLNWQVKEIDWTGYIIIIIESSYHFYLKFCTRIKFNRI